MSATKWTIRKRYRRWVVMVPPHTVAAVGFAAPFETFDEAVAYVHYWANR